MTIKRDYPQPHILKFYFNQNLSSDIALGELIDNAFDANATNVHIQFDSASVTVTDNGEGLSDLNKLFTLGGSYSQSNADAIGGYGNGAKLAQVHFGTRVHAQSVCEGRYYQHRRNWNKVLVTGEWPEMFSGQSKPVAFAPNTIRNGGTILTITELTKRQNIRMDFLCAQLSFTYRLGLLNGLDITLVDDRRKKGIVYNLEPSTNVPKCESIYGEVDGRNFELRVGSLNEYDSTLSGIHFGFGSRFVKHVTKIGDRSTPTLLYTEVLLAPEWKNHLTPTKDNILDEEYEALGTAVYTLLKDHMQKLDRHIDFLKIEKVNLRLGQDFANVVVLNPKKPGTNTTGDEVTTTGGSKGPRPVVPNPHEKNHLPVHSDNKGHDTQGRKKRPPGIGFQQEPLGLEVVSKCAEQADGTLIIQLNSDIKAIRVAYEPPYKPMALWPYIALEFAKWCKENAKDLDRLLPGFIETLNDIGYAVTTEKPEQMADRIAVYVMNQVPLTAKERGRGNISLVEDDDTATA